MRHNESQYNIMTHFGVLEFNNLNFQKERLLGALGTLGADRQKQNDISSITMLKKALVLAEKAHQNQTRDEGIPYVIHPVRAANILYYEKNLDDAELLSAVLLHDVVEDSPISLIDIKSHFTDKVALLVKNLTRERPQNETEEQKQKNKTEKFLTIMAADVETRLAKCADLLDNLRCWPLIPVNSPSRKKFPRWLQETKNFAIPLAEKTDPYLAEKMKQAFEQIKKICQESICQA